MDLILLGDKLKKDSITYASEFESELDRFESLLELPQIPIKQMKPLLAFIIKNCHVNNKRSLRLLLDALSKIRDFKIRKSILCGLILFRQKKIIESSELLRMILMYGRDYKLYFKACQEYVDIGCYEVLKEWYYKGDEKQKSFTYYLLLIIFSNEKDNVSNPNIEDNYRSEDKLPDSISIEKFHKRNINEELESLICEGFFGTSKLSKICILYFLNMTEINFDISRIKNGYEYGKRIYLELSEKIIERDIKIKKAQIFLLFKNSFKIKKSITKILLAMIDIEKEDLRDIFDCLILSVDNKEVYDVLKLISEEFVNENKDDDIVCYGLNILREIYSKFIKINEEGENSNISDKFLDDLKDAIMGYVSIFSGVHTKSIHYAYKSLVKTVIHHQIIDREITFILKSKTKEEREKLRIKNREERKKEISKELYKKKQKKNRKGKINKRKNRLNMLRKRIKK